MKQVVQNYKTGEVLLKEVPVSSFGRQYVLVRNEHSLVSIGTERSIVDLGKKSLLGKAQARPDLVKRVLEKIKTEGIKKTFQEVQGRLDVPTPLGYSSSGVVVEAGDEAHEFAVGDRVACIGQGFASHAEFVSVPKNLVCKLPDNVSSEAAAFGMLGIIALHGIRKANLTFGSSVVVVGLGLLGLLSVQILKAYGCSVIATDLLEEKINLAKKFGADFATIDIAQLHQYTKTLTHGHGVDAVVLTMSTESSEPVSLAIELARKQGKIVVVGTANISPNRNELWHKEVELVVSKAGGPGSLEVSYEKHHLDYPIEYVRWTEKRNLEEFIHLMASGRMDMASLITHRFSIDQAEKVYEDMLQGQLTSAIGILFDYPLNSELKQTVQLKQKMQSKDKEVLSMSVMGAGIFGKSLLIPQLAKFKKIQLQTLVTSSGVNAQHTAQKFGFNFSSTDFKSVFYDQQTDAVFALTPHHAHAEIVQLAIQNQKALFIEKPLCINQQELSEIIATARHQSNLPLIMVGHNRRFSPHATKMKYWLRNRTQPLVLSMQINAGFVSSEHWVHQAQEGRSRIVGEMSHFVDLMQYLIQASPGQVYAEKISGDDQVAVNNDNLSVIIKFSDGSLGNLIYSAMGSRQYPRESVKIFFDGCVIDSLNFCQTDYYDGKHHDRFKTSGQSMGYQEELAHFIGFLQGKIKSSGMIFEEIILTMKTIFAIEQSLSEGKPVKINLT